MTKLAVTETICICKDRNILKQYLIGKEVEVMTIMMSLFDHEQIMRTYVKDMAKEMVRETAKETAKETTKKNVMTMLKMDGFL